METQRQILLPADDETFLLPDGKRVIGNQSIDEDSRGNGNKHTVLSYSLIQVWSGEG